MYKADCADAALARSVVHGICIVENKCDSPLY